MTQVSRDSDEMTQMTQMTQMLMLSGFSHNFDEMTLIVNETLTPSS